jgi:hypothetical protein
VKHALAWLDGPLGVVVLAAVLLLALGWYLSYLAARLDRLHHRVESSRAALEARLALRAAAAREAARLLPPPEAERVGRCAGRALADPLDEAVENDLTRALHDSFGDPAVVAGLAARTHRTDGTGEGPAGSPAPQLLAELESAGDRVQLARRFHNDAVAHAQRMRRKRLVRWARLAGRAAMPRMMEIDDSQPAALVLDPSAR